MPWAPTAKCVDCRRRPRVSGRRCRPCARAYEQQRGSRQQRGLGAEYERERRAVLAGATHCASCGQPFSATRRPTAGHVVPRVRGGGSQGNLRPECEPCNYGHGGRL